ncbi:ABC transporter permease [bacterium]|nr:ABC transporter permease [bacterium]
MLINVILNIVQQGLCYALVALGVYISYKILNFPDLTVDSSFPLGAVVCISLIQIGCPYIIATLVAFIAGAFAGFITGFLHVKFKMNNLLSGIITMTALLSINIALSRGRTLVPYGDKKTIFNNSFVELFGDDIRASALANILILVVIVLIMKIMLDLFFKTQRGFMLRAVGNNEQMSTSLGSNIGIYKVLGLSIANGMVGLAGAIYSQYMNYFDNTSGTGMVVIALASVIIGIAIFSKARIIKGTTAAIIGAIIYTAALNLVIAIGVPTTYLKLFMALAFALVLILNNYLIDKKKKIKREEGQKNV